jgi:hypothetical protein
LFVAGATNNCRVGILNVRVADHPIAQAANTFVVVANLALGVFRMSILCCRCNMKLIALASPV